MKIQIKWKKHRFIRRSVKSAQNVITRISVASVVNASAQDLGVKSKLKWRPGPIEKRVFDEKQKKKDVPERP